ncbi:MAG: multidrug effflux MFS transporter [Janthinobacterium lividum]
MVASPVFKNFSTKTYDIILILLIALIYAATLAATDIYVPAFPNMITYFGVHENQIQLILSINFAGLCVTSLLIGPLSDSFGRRKIMVYSLLLFLISSGGCVIATSYKSMLIWRFIQGLSAAAPMIVGGAIIADRYTEQRAGQLIGMLNSVISASMAGAPILGAWITQVFNWRLNFVIVFLVALAIFLMAYLTLEETLPDVKRKKFRWVSFVHDHLKIFKNLRFVCYTIIVNFPFIAIVIYVANLSVIMINHLGFDLEQFSYYQASTMGVFIIFSLLSVKMIQAYGLDKTKDLGMWLTILGGFGLFLISCYDKTNINIICLSMASIAAGGALMAGPYGMKTLALFPDMKGTSMGVLTAFRQFSAAGLIILTEIFFDGTIVPIAIIIFVYALITLLCWYLVRAQEY